MSFQAKTYSYSEDYPIHSKTLEDPSFQDAEYSESPEELDPGREDLDVYSSEGEVQAEPSGYSAPDADSLRAQLHDLESSPKGAELEQKIQELRGLLNQAQGFVSEGQKNSLLSQVQAELSALEAQTLGTGPSPLDSGAAPSSVQLEGQLQDYKKQIQSMEQLSQEDKDQLTGRIDHWLSEINLGEANPEGLDLDGISQEFEDLKGEIGQFGETPSGVRALASMVDMEPEALLNKAKAKGLDLNHLPSPPTQELIEFLVETLPELKSSFDEAKDTLNERVKFYEDNLHSAKAQNNSNDHSTTDGDNKDMTAWQNLYDLKFHQDEKSQVLREKIKGVRGQLVSILQGLYPDAQVKASEVSGFSGWEKDHQEFLNADKIYFGGQTLDIFNNQDGSSQVSSSESEAAIEIPIIKYDGEGDGQWRVPELRIYGDEHQVDAVNYDPDA